MLPLFMFLMRVWAYLSLSLFKYLSVLQQCFHIFYFPFFPFSDCFNLFLNFFKYFFFLIYSFYFLFYYVVFVVSFCFSRAAALPLTFLLRLTLVWPAIILRLSSTSCVNVFLRKYFMRLFVCLKAHKKMSLFLQKKKYIYMHNKFFFDSKSYLFLWAFIPDAIIFF